jgi:outer membrane biosynthesis protein TonB
MALAKLRREERIGLALAVALHGGLFAVLALHRASPPPPLPLPISVTLSDETGLTATAPRHGDAAPDTAPALGAPPPAEVAPAPSPPPPRVEPLPMEKPVAEPKPVAVMRDKPEPIAPPKPVPKRQPVTPPHHPPKVEDTIGKTIAAAAPAKPAPRHLPSVKDWALAMPTGKDLAGKDPAKDKSPVGGSRIGNDFLKGVAGGKASGKAPQQGAAVIGPEVKSALSGAIAHQLKPHWAAPEGADADQLVTVLSWDLGSDGALAGEPHVLRQEGITDSNRPQAPRHAEQAIRAVRLAAPFNLPAPYYSAWKHVAAFRFDRKLSQ